MTKIIKIDQSYGKVRISLCCQENLHIPLCFLVLAMTKACKHQNVTKRTNQAGGDMKDSDIKDVL